MKRLAYGAADLGPMAVLTSWRKCLSMNERLLCLRMVSINTQSGMFVYSDVTLAVTKKRCQVEVGVFKEL